MESADPSPSDPLALQLLNGQLERMRGMLFAYSHLFFRHIRTYTLVVLGLLVAASWPPLGAAALVVPFLVPFVFLEASYLFWYTVFARRHAEWLERVIARRTGGAVPGAHRLEAAYFYAPDDPKIAALSLRRPLSHMSAVTAGYTVGAFLSWLAGLTMAADWIARHGQGQPLLALAIPAALAWTAAIVLYLVWAWLRGADERRLVRELEAVYPDGAVDQTGAPTGS
jgi:hypothetical protein